jgi:hypothetical protein
MATPFRIVWLTLGAIVFASPGEAQLIDRVLATVGGQVITLSDAKAAIALGLADAGRSPDPMEGVLASLVDRELMLAEINRYAAPEPTEAAVRLRLDQVRGRFPSEAAYEAALAQTAMADGRIRDIVRDNLRVEAYLDQRFAAPAQPTREEVARYYEEHQSAFTHEGRLQPLEEVRPVVEEQAAADRRRVLASDWIQRLRSRTEVILTEKSIR